ncbi:MAG: molybdopterin-dependent oxidoreductase [Planctomycetes bacterium]|nr:molybdopterin-dependent oxidoreductase [Planctomycetota bacterium]
MQMIDAAAIGQLKALWVIGYDVALTNPQAAATIDALRKVDLLIVQDLFLTETARLAGSVFLPACSSFEKEGTFMNSERRIQRLRKVIEPRGESRTDWEIVAQVARAMGKAEPLDFNSAEEIGNEIRLVWPGAKSISYQRLENQGIQWPCPSADHPGTEVLHADIASGARRVKLRRVRFAPTAEQVSEEFPFLLNSGRTLYQFNAGTMTGISRTNQLHPRDLVDISVLDAQRLGIADGQTVRLRSRYGSATITASISSALKPGELFATFSSPEVFLNHLTSNHRDKHVQTPEYKVTAVQIEVTSDIHRS